MRRLISLVGVVVGMASLLASTKVGPDFAMPATTFTLANGLTVVMSEDHSTPNAAVELWIRAGTRYEDVGHWGQAHFFEHMFGATRLPVAPGRVLDGNAQTRRDFCRYYLLVGGEALEYALALQADRLDFPLEAMDEARLAANRDIVINEYRGNESRPFGFGSPTDVKLLVNGFGPQHPYGRPIQLNADVSRLTAVDMRRWIAERHLPSESLLVVVGDVSVNRARPMVEHYFGPIPRGKGSDPVVVRMRLEVEPIQPTPERRERLDVAAPAGRLLSAWATPAYGSADADYLMVFDEILAAPDVGRLYQRMVDRERLAATTAADAQVEELGGLIRATVELRPGADPRSAESIFFETLDGLLQAGPTEVELQTAKARLRARFARQLEQLGFQGSRAELLGEGMLFSGNAAAYQQRLDRMADASRDQVIRTARTWVSKHGYFLNAVARGQTERSATIDRTKPVALPDPAPAAFPAVETRRLESGIRLVTLARPESLLTNVTLVAPAQRGIHPDEDPGMLARALTDRDPSNRSDRAQAWRACVGAGCTIDVTADAQASVVSVNSLSTAMGIALQATATLVAPDAVDQTALTRAQADAQSRRAALDPTARARTELAALLGSPGTDHRPGGITDAIDAASFSKDGATLIVAGAFDRAALDTMVNDWFGKSTGSFRAPASATAPAPVTVDRDGVYVIDVPGRPQTVIAAGHRLAPLTSDNWVATRLAAAVLTARINTNLRERHQWSYGAQATLASAAYDAPTIVLSTEVQADRTAAAMGEIRQEWTAPVGPSDVTRLAFYRRDLMQQIVGGIGSVSRLAGALAELARQGVAPTAYSDLLKQAASTNEKTVGAALGLLHGDALMFVIAGDVAQLRPQLQAAGIRVRPIP